MYKISRKIGLRILILVLVVCNFKSEAQTNDDMNVLSAVSNLNRYEMNREILFNSETIELIRNHITEYNFKSSIYKGLEKVNSANDFSKNDIEELITKINFSNYPTKWNIKKLRKEKISTTRYQVGNKKNAPLFQVSPPIFFKERKFAIIYVRIWCGLECGSREIKVFKKLGDGSFEYYGEISIDIS